MAEPSGCLFAIFKLLSGPGGRATAALPYRKKDYLFTAAERSFFGALTNAVEGRYFIFAKVRVGDLVWMPKGTESRQAHWNRVQSKHVDFVLCSLDNVAPLLCIELDDASHSRPDRVERDAFLDAALSAAGLPLLHVRASRAYNVAALRHEIAQYLRR